MQRRLRDMTKVLPPEKAALHRAAAVLGGQAALALLLGYEDRRKVWPWFNTKRQFPAEHCPIVEHATREKGQVVTCDELRPDVKWELLRIKCDGACHQTSPAG